MIDFQPITSISRTEYDKYLFAESDRGCELSYGNLNMWGNQKFAFLQNQLLLLSQYGTHFMYPFPFGDGNKKEALDAILSDAKERQIPCCISSLTEERAAYLEELYPNQFRFHFNRNSYDYVYEIEKLAALKGRKYHRKRNHYHRFCKNHPDFRIEPITSANLPQVLAFAHTWYTNKQAENPEENFHHEQQAFERGIAHYEKLRLDGIILLHNEEILAFSIGNPLSADTFDVNFEKARWDIEGAYTAINCEFAKYIQAKYPHILYLDREEDMGVEGLRKAKESYFPHHMIQRGFAVLKESTNED